jgi:ubiquinone/menaquinone biosynthesis C-methylase UbiE
MKMVLLEKWFINSEKHVEMVRKRAEKLLQSVDIKENQNYLEVGCGSGGVCKYIAEKYPWNVTGVDVDPAQVRMACESCRDLQNARFLEADATKLPFPDKEFDIVLTFGTTHHIPDWLGALGEMRRVLRPEGYFIYYDMVYKTLAARLGRSISRNYGIITMPEINSFVRENNYSEIQSMKKNSLIWSEYEAVYKSN